MKKIIFGTMFFIIVFLVTFIFFTQKSIQAPLITQSFNSYVIKENPSAKLIAYELHTVEKMEYKKNLNLLWKLISFANVDTQMLVPVHYSFYIDLHEGFDLKKEGEELVVYAPELKSYTPAINVSGISFVVKEAPMLYDVSKIEKAFYKNLTQMINQRSEELKYSYHDKAAESLKALIAKWIQQNGYKGQIDPDNVRIQFKTSEAIVP